MGTLLTHPGRTRRGVSAALAVAGLALAVPAAGQAAYTTFGSDLSAPADATAAHKADTALWSTALSGGALPTAPAQGQIKEIRLKGIAPRSTRPPAPGQDPAAGSPLVHFQVLEPVDGTMRAKTTSAGFNVPTAGDPQQVSSFKPENLCVAPGDSVAFNTIGGWDGIANRDPANGPVGQYPDGTVFQIFSKRPGTSTAWFEAHGFWVDQSTSGSPFRPRPGHQADRGGTLENQELLMQLVLATGDDRSYECGGPNTYRPADPPAKPKPGGGGAPPGVQKATIPKSQKVNVSRKGVAGMAIFCQAGPGACAGTVTVYAKNVVIATRQYSVGAKSTGKLKLKLNKAGKKLFKKKKQKLPVRIVAVTKPGGDAYTDTYSVTMKRIGAR